MRLEQLQYLSAIRKYHSMILAGEQLHISQQNISLAIANLENELGFTLVERTNKGSKLTEAGEEFASFGEKILEEYLVLRNKYLEKENIPITNLNIYMEEQFKLSDELLLIINNIKNHLGNKLVTKFSYINSYQELFNNSIYESLPFIAFAMVSEEEYNSISPKVFKHILTIRELGIKMSIDNPLTKYRAISLKKLNKQNIIILRKKNSQLDFMLKLLQEYKIEENNNMHYDIPTYMIDDLLKEGHLLFGFFSYEDFEKKVYKTNSFYEQIFLPVMENITVYTVLLTNSKEIYEKVSSSDYENVSSSEGMV